MKLQTPWVRKYIFIIKFAYIFDMFAPFEAYQ